MDTLAKASQIKFDVFKKPHFVSSIGVEGYGNISSFDLLAGAMNFKGYRTKKGKYITGSYLAVMKDRLTKKYGEDFIADLVDWEMVSTQVVPPLHRAGMEKKPNFKLGSCLSYN